MRSFIKVSAVLSLALASLVPSIAEAQAGRPGRGPVTPPQSVRPPTESELRAAPGVQIIQIQPTRTVPWGTLQAFNAAMMQGWTPVTNGATQGGASVFKLGTGYRIVVRAGNSGLYEAPIDIMSTSPVDASAWRSLGVSATSEPYCLPEANSSENYFCSYLGQGGSANVSRIANANWGSNWNLGGSNGGSRVTLARNPSSNYSGGQLVTSIRALVWDGGTRLFARHFANQGGGLAGSQFVDTMPANLQGWKVLQGPSLTPVGCNRWTGSMDICAQGTTNGVRLFSDPWSAAALGGALPQTFATTPTFPEPIGRTAPEVTNLGSGGVVVVMRAASGAVYHTRRGNLGGNFSPWVSEGGAARDGSGISCVAVNEQPICFIQGPDGRIYRKAFATASGL